MLACLGLLLSVVSCLAVHGFWSTSADYGVYVHFIGSYTSVDTVLILLQRSCDHWVQLHVMVC